MKKEAKTGIFDEKVAANFRCLSFESFVFEHFVFFMAGNRDLDFTWLMIKLGF